jgi:hypothetical protein
MAATAVPGYGTLGLGMVDVAAAADELRMIRQPNVEKLAGLPRQVATAPEIGSPRCLYAGQGADCASP